MNILIIGATSSIAHAIARLYTKNGNNLYLLARDKDKIDTIKKDLDTRGASSIHTNIFEATDFEKHDAILEQAHSILSHIDIAIIAHGSLPSQKECEKSTSMTISECETNAISTISLLTTLANIMTEQQHGSICVITSVAGERGRQSNYVYGASKAMVSIFLQGLRHRLFKHGVHVIDVKPGFVDTPMTASFKKGALWASPEKVAKDIVKGIKKHKKTIYTPWFWFIIMLIIRNIPEFIFVRSSL